MSQKAVARLFCFLAILLIFLSSCASSPQTIEPLPPTDNPKPTDVPPTTIPTAPAGELITTPNKIIGTWKGSVEGEPGYLIIRDDGTVSLSPNEDGSSGNTHTYWLEGDQFNIKHDLAIHSCDQVGHYQIRIKQDGDKTISLAFMLIEDPCKPRVRDLVDNTPAWVFEPSPSISNEAIAGTYLVTLTEQGLTAAGVNNFFTNDLKNRTWQLEFTKDGVARLSEETDIGMRLRAEGPFTLSVDEITFGADTGVYACAEFGIEQGTYGWKLESDQLTLAVTEDECEHRGVIYSTQPWTKQP